MALTATQAIAFFKLLNDTKSIRNAIGVRASGVVEEIYAKQILFDDDAAPTAGLVLVETSATVEIAYRTPMWLDLSKAADPDFPFVELYLSKDQLIFGEPNPYINPNQSLVFETGSTATLTLEGRFLTSGVTVESLPAEVTLDNVTQVSLEELELEFSNTFASGRNIVGNLRLVTPAGESTNTFTLDIREP